MPKYHGKHGVMYLAASGSGAAARVANLTQWSLSIKADKAETAGLGDEGKSFVRGLKGATVTGSGFWSDDQDIPFDAFDSDELVRCYLYPSKLAPSKYWYGYIWPDGVDVDVAVSAAAAMKVAAEFDTNGGTNVITRVG